MKLLDMEKLESVLVANWSQFMDSREAMNYVRQIIEDHANRLGIINGSDFKNKGTRLTISRFMPMESGYLVWFDLNSPIRAGYAEATVEVRITNLGDMRVSNVSGVVYVA
jgi:hypothetical protein